MEQTIYAEYPRQKEWIEKLREARTSHTLETLAEIWEVSQERSIVIANELEQIGFFEPRGTRQEKQYWVPFLYRDALGLIQGAAF